MKTGNEAYDGLVKSRTRVVAMLEPLPAEVIQLLLDRVKCRMNDGLQITEDELIDAAAMVYFTGILEQRFREHVSESN